MTEGQQNKIAELFEPIRIRLGVDADEFRLEKNELPFPGFTLGFIVGRFFIRVAYGYGIRIDHDDGNPQFVMYWYERLYDAEVTLLKKLDKKVSARADEVFDEIIIPLVQENISSFQSAIGKALDRLHELEEKAAKVTLES